jgi:hypothetical protein
MKRALAVFISKSNKKLIFLTVLIIFFISITVYLENSIFYVNIDELCLSRSSLGLKLKTEAYKKGLIPSAILINYNRPENIPLIIKNLVISGLFDSIIIWDAGRLNLNIIPGCVNLTIIKGENLGTLARYNACIQSEGNVCYVQDDDWDTSSYIHSLFISFLREPNFIHTVTDKNTWWGHNHKWSYFNEEIGLHTRHTWVGCGSFFRKNLAHKHIMLSKKFLTSDLTPILNSCDLLPAHSSEPIFHCDIAFNLFNNKFPIDLIASHLVPLEIERSPIAPGYCGSLYLEYLSRNIAQIVITSLKMERESSIFHSKTFISHYFAKAVCQHGYPCVFLSNSNLSLGEDFALAVDGDLDSLWISSKLKDSDWYGIDFFMQEILRLRIVFSHDLHFQKGLLLEETSDFLIWNTLAHNVYCSTHATLNYCEYSFGRSISVVRFTCLEKNINSLEFHFRVHEVNVFPT